MEIEKTPNEYAKKMWKIVRIMFCMMRKSMAKSKLVMLANLHMLVERGKIIASKAMIGNLITVLHHHDHHSYYSALTCRPDDDITASFISPREYEFSCRSSPIFPASKHKTRGHHSRRQAAEEFKLMQKSLRNVNMNRYDDPVAKSSPLLPGFGQSPLAARQADSPFSVKEVELSHQVDRDAEEFIKKFYKDLRIQKRIAAALESPSPYHMWAS